MRISLRDEGKLGAGKGFGHVGFAIESGDAEGFLDAALATGPAHKDDDIYGFGDQVERRTARRFERELFEALERAARRVGV